MRLRQNAVIFRSLRERTFFAALTVALLLGTLSQSQAADPEPKRVLMLHSFGLRFKPWTDHARIARSEITRQSQAPIDFQDHSLLDARQFNEKSEASFVEYLHNLYDDSATRPYYRLRCPRGKLRPAPQRAAFSPKYRWFSPRLSSVEFSGTN